MTRLLINVGVMRFVTPDVTMSIRSKTLPLKVKQDTSFISILNLEKEFNDKTVISPFYPSKHLVDF